MVLRLPRRLLPVRATDDEPRQGQLRLERLGVGSTSEARRLIEQGGVKLNGSPATGLDVPRDALAGALLQVGKRRFARLTA